jgi:hypothetical protein
VPKNFGEFDSIGGEAEKFGGRKVWLCSEKSAKKKTVGWRGLCELSVPSTLLRTCLVREREFVSRKGAKGAKFGEKLTFELTFDVRERKQL